MSKPSHYLIVVDMTEVIQKNMQFKSLYEVYRRFTLKELIENILSISPYIDYSDQLYDVLSTKFNDEEITFDEDAFQIFYECLIEDVDHAVKEQYRFQFENIDHSSYFFRQWIDHTSLILRLEL